MRIILAISGEAENRGHVRREKDGGHWTNMRNETNTAADTYIASCDDSSLNESARLDLAGHSLTEQGRLAALQWRSRIPLTDEDAIIAGPMLSMVQTGELWSGASGCARFIHPLAGPRLHPHSPSFEHLESHEQDRVIEPDCLQAAFPDWLYPPDLPEYLWVQGIHALPTFLFEQQAKRFLDWCAQLGRPRVVIVTAPGTRIALRGLLQQQMKADSGELRSITNVFRQEAADL
ncbi:histidine phosphatase family protein [Paenibacillus sp. YYML68]|uniref:histidine phosphatase family protein n=1 Tax=Paenibacillus sp. YYML68 TaxID=2909250 RepID=UPI002490AAD6|nr:histidine phosphatase family protein [Paenibacillus sp. YYML68]